jgi:hypothetical protein
MKKCPPGVICIENMSIIFILIIVLVISYMIYINISKTKKTDEEIQQQNNPYLENTRTTGFFNIVQTPSYPYTNLLRDNYLPKDVLLNPYAAPYKDERYFIPELTYVPPGTVPINVSTNIGAVDTNYRQLGILTPLNGASKDNILPMMGRPLFTNRDKWQYYTISNQHNNVKLPVSVKGKSALNDYGVDQVYNGDTVFVEGYNQPFKVTIYETDTIKYLPFV